MVLRETDKHFLLAMSAATGMILFWRGIWEGFGALPVLENPWVDLFLGAAILTFTGIIFSQFDPLGGIERGTTKALQSIHHHPQKHEFSVRYYDNVKRREVELKAEYIRQIERNVVVFHHKGRELFVPLHRVRSVHRNGEVVWKL